MAVIQANRVLEDYSQLESGPQGTFVGVYDGHAGDQASKFVSHNLFFNLKNAVSDNGEVVTESVVKKAFHATEEEYLSMVKKQWLNMPQIASAGTCCLVGLICSGTLFVANAGDSRAVLGRVDRGSKRATPVQLCNEHNVNIESVREELRSLHPDDSQVVIMKHKSWRVRGLIQGIAKRLLKSALHEAAKKREMRYADLKKIDAGVRRHFHDDITIVIVFIDYQLVSKIPLPNCPPYSIKGGDVICS
ncbi:Probable protein phosphatase 2C 38 [Linum perenne]